MFAGFLAQVDIAASWGYVRDYYLAGSCLHWSELEVIVIEAQKSYQLLPFSQLFFISDLGFLILVGVIIGNSTDAPVLHISTQGNPQLPKWHTQMTGLYKSPMLFLHAK